MDEHCRQLGPYCTDKEPESVGTLHSHVISSDFSTDESEQRLSSSSDHDSSSEEIAPHLSWSQSLHNLLNDSEGVKLLYKFLVDRQHDKDKVDFWFACKGVKNPRFDVNQMVKTIFNTYVKSRLKIDDDIRKHIHNKIRHGDINREIFNEAQKEIEEIIEKTVYIEFLKSNVYLDYVHKIQCNNDPGQVSEAIAVSDSTVDNSALQCNSENGTKEQVPSVSIKMKEIKADAGYSHESGLRSQEIRPRPKGREASENLNPKQKINRISKDHGELLKEVQFVAQLQEKLNKLKWKQDREMNESFQNKQDSTSIFHSAFPSRKFSNLPPQLLSEAFQAKLSLACENDQAILDNHIDHVWHDTENISSPVQQVPPVFKSPTANTTDKYQPETSIDRVIIGASDCDLYHDDHLNYYPSHLNSSKHDKVHCSRFTSGNLLIDNIGKGIHNHCCTGSATVWSRLSQDENSKSNHIPNDNKCLHHSTFSTTESCFKKESISAECQSRKLKPVMLQQHNKESCNPYMNTGGCACCKMQHFCVSCQSQFKRTSFDHTRLAEGIEDSSLSCDTTFYAKQSAFPYRPVHSEVHLDTERVPPNSTSHFTECSRGLPDGDSAKLERKSSSHGEKGGKIFQSKNSINYKSRKSQGKCGKTNTSSCTEETVIGYRFFGETVPYKSKISGKDITLHQFKSILTRKGKFRFFFKTASSEFETGVLYQEVSDDHEVLPTWEGKIFAIIEPIG